LFPRIQQAAGEIDTSRSALRRALGLLSQHTEGKNSAEDIKRVTEQIQAAHPRLDDATQRLPKQAARPICNRAD
jgi:hypothetical protein